MYFNSFYSLIRVRLLLLVGFFVGFLFLFIYLFIIIIFFIFFLGGGVLFRTEYFIDLLFNNYFF